MLRTFADPDSRPTGEALAGSLGDAWPAWRSMLELAGSFQGDWILSKGWILKVHDGKKALWYLIPRNCSFTVSMAVREPEREALLADASVGPALREKLESARRFAEGFALKLDVAGPDDLPAVEPFLRALIELRK